MRRLSLRRETLADLTADELSGVAGGATQVCVTRQVLCPTNQATLCHLCQLLTQVTC